MSGIPRIGLDIQAMVIDLTFDGSEFGDIKG
jgi:hypothetical protein